MKKNTFSFIIFIIIISGLVYVIQRTYETKIYNNRAIPQEDFKYLPSGKFLKGAALSFDEVLADLLWIKTIGYFGGHYQTDRNFQWLKQLLDVTTTLDPYFEDPYEFGGIILAAELGDVDGSIEILKKGMDNVPKHHKRYWYLPFFTAFNYMYYKGDYQTAAHYLEIAASFPQRPAYLPLLVARLYANTNDPTVVIPFLEKMLERAVTPDMKKKIKKRIAEIKIKKHLLILTKAQDQYKKRTGKYPEKLTDLVDIGLIPAIPVEPFGGKYFIAESDHSIKTTSNVDDMVVHITPKTNLNKKKQKEIPFMLRENN